MIHTTNHHYMSIQEIIGAHDAKRGLCKICVCYLLAADSHLAFYDLAVSIYLKVGHRIIEKREEAREEIVAVNVAQLSFLL